MKKIIFAALLTVVSVGVFAQKKTPEMKVYDYTVTRVVDGDTVEFAAPFLPAPLKPRLAVRVFGVDTPEKSFRAKCESEAKRGEAASAFTKKVISESKTARVAIIDWDKFGGRVLGDIILDNNVSLRALLIQNGFAREYYGEAKQSWCD
jgi:endonuclease YncB( thermonuclease family)